MMTGQTIGQRIAEQRKRLGISQVGLATRLDVSRQAISKWESDAAMPEVDKLITLSRMFGVTVGWLLGVEEQTVRQEENFSESQLKLVEELIRKYQQPPAPRLTVFHYLFAIGTSLLIFLFLFSQTSRIEQYLQNKVDIPMYNGLAARVTILEDYLDIEAKASNSLLAQYAFGKSRYFSVAQNAMSNNIVLQFTATPSYWQEGDVAFLSARKDGHELYRQECEWDGAILSADMGVAMQNGYEYALILYHPDGTQEQQMLYDEGAQNLFDHFSIVMEVVPGKFNYKNGVLTLSGYTVSATQPEAYFGYQRWEKLEFVLCRRGPAGEEVELGRDTVLDAIQEEDIGILEGETIQISNHLIQFRDVAVTEDSCLELRLYAKLNNGEAREVTVQLLCPDGKGGIE